MLSKTRGMPVHSSAPGVIPHTITDPVSNGASAAADADRAPAQASAAPGQSYPARDSAATERDERRHQRAVTREGNARDGAKTAERFQPAKAQPTGPSRRGRLVIGETVSVGLIGIIVVGLIAGAILGALGASGWVVGLLVATLTVILSAVLRRSTRQH